MILDVASLLALAGSCAPSVAPETLISIVHTESRFNTLAIGVNSPGARKPVPATRAQAIAAARRLIRQGYNIDLGLGQINSANLGWLGLSVEDAFEPCRNLAAAARVLTTNYQSVAHSAQSSDHAIATALSLYNTGDRRRGFRNGYVARVYASASTIIPPRQANSAGLPARVRLPTRRSPNGNPLGSQWRRRPVGTPLPMPGKPRSWSSGTGNFSKGQHP
jgi:type IV secretion system protein VirB1